MENISVAIDLTGVKKIESGIGYYVMNLLCGFETFKSIDFHLILSEDNYDLFSAFKKNPNFFLHRTKCKSCSKVKRLIWVNANLSRLINKLGINICIEPYYCMPIFGTKKVKYITTIHDLQALHYPEFQSKLQNIWLRFMWKQVAKKAYKIVTISNFSKEDIEKNLKISSDKVCVIYIASLVKKADPQIYQLLADKYHIQDNEYYYTVSKLRPNKNLSVLLEMIAYLKELDSSLSMKLLISGSNGGDADRIKRLVSDLGIQDNVVLTGFVSDDERNALYEHAKAFLFPSIFEGFGMPVIEAMSLGTMVITTDCTSLFEVTQGKANYVTDPHDVTEWVRMLSQATNHSNELDRIPYTQKEFAEGFVKLIEAAR